MKEGWRGYSMDRSSQLFTINLRSGKTLLCLLGCGKSYTGGEASPQNGEQESSVRVYKKAISKQ